MRFLIFLLVLQTISAAVETVKRQPKSENLKKVALGSRRGADKMSKLLNGPSKKNNRAQKSNENKKLKAPAPPQVSAPASEFLGIQTLDIPSPITTLWGATVDPADANIFIADSTFNVFDIQKNIYFNFFGSQKVEFSGTYPQWSAFDPNNADVMYIADYDIGLYKVTGIKTGGLVVTLIFNSLEDYGRCSSSVVVDPKNSNVLYLGDEENDQVFKLDITDPASPIITPFLVDISAPYSGIAITPDGSKLFVSDNYAYEQSIVLLDPRDPTIPGLAVPGDETLFGSIAGLAIDATGTKLYAVDYDHYVVYLIDIKLIPITLDKITVLVDAATLSGAEGLNFIPWQLTLHAATGHLYVFPYNEYEDGTQDGKLSARIVAVPPPPKCPKGYKYYPLRNTCYAAVGEAVTWFYANLRCQSKGAHLISIENLEEESFVLNEVLHNNGMSFWTGLNRLDNPSSRKMRWYLAGTPYVADTGYRGSVHSADLSLPGVAGSDAFCAAWLFDEGKLKGLSPASCSNSPVVVDSFICEYNL